MSAHAEEHKGQAPKLPPGVIVAPGKHELGAGEKMYLSAIAHGLINTFKHLIKPKFTIDYDGTDKQNPKKAYTPRSGYRGEHYLKKDDAGHVKCVACFMCAAACPAECIHIEAQAAPPEMKDRERIPKRFEIDLLRCIYCGMCEEACPVDAIALSSIFNQVTDARVEKVWDMEMLLKRGEELGLSLSKHHYRPDGVPGAVPEGKSHG